MSGTSQQQIFKKVQCSHSQDNLKHEEFQGYSFFRQIKKNKKNFHGKVNNLLFNSTSLNYFFLNVSQFLFDGFIKVKINMGALSVL